MKEQVAKIYSLLLWGNKWGYSSRPTFRRLHCIGMLIFYLSAFMIQMVFIPVDQFGNGNNRIALVFQLRNQRIQRLSREFCPVRYHLVSM